MPEPSLTGRLDDRIRLALLVVPSVILLLDLPTLLTSAAHYRPDRLEVSSYAGLALVTAIAAVLVLRRRPWGWFRWPLLTAALVATTAATAAMQPADLFGTPHWSWDIFGWWAVLFLLDRPLRELLVVIAVHVAVSVAQLVAGGEAQRPTVVGMAISAAALGGLPVGAWLAGASARRNAARAAATAEAIADGRLAEQVAAEIHRDRRSRYAEISAAAGPLLAALADGTADPGDPAVRRACFVEAARLRRLFAEADGGDDPLVHELAACADTAARRGITVSVAVRGDHPLLSSSVRAAMTDTAVQALAAAQSTARVTVVSLAGEVTVTVVADLAGAADRPVLENDRPMLENDGEVIVSWDVRSGSLWAEATWTAAP